MVRLYVLVLMVSVGIALVAGRAPTFRPSNDGARPPVTLTASAEPAAAAAEPAPMQATSNDGSVDIERSADGHFYADVQINGTQVHMMVDTGASGIALTRDDAASAGLAPAIGMNQVIGRGADGDVHGEFVMLNRVALGPKSVERVPAAILDSGSQSLLGQAFLRQFGTVQITGDRMLLQ